MVTIINFHLVNYLRRNQSYKPDDGRCFSFLLAGLFLVNSYQPHIVNILKHPNQTCLHKKLFIKSKKSKAASQTFVLTLKSNIRLERIRKMSKYSLELIAQSLLGEEQSK